MPKSQTQAARPLRCVALLYRTAHDLAPLPDPAIWEAGPALKCTPTSGGQSCEMVNCTLPISFMNIGHNPAPNGDSPDDLDPWPLKAVSGNANVTSSICGYTGTPNDDPGTRMCQFPATSSLSCGTMQYTQRYNKVYDATDARLSVQISRAGCDYLGGSVASAVPQGGT